MGVYGAVNSIEPLRTTHIIFYLKPGIKTFRLSLQLCYALEIKMTKRWNLQWTTTRTYTLPVSFQLRVTACRVKTTSTSPHRRLADKKWTSPLCTVNQLKSSLIVIPIYNTLFYSSIKIVSNDLVYYNCHNYYFYYIHWILDFYYCLYIGSIFYIGAV